ncbi:hypothetical protein [Edaphobacter aggregans]|uniref:hypothetical protein n=1 Tax=Edaphobacter aggregans TaxID=570835 RepID=UPI0005503D5B|nr:hypothetical protein [Edaphobacter aggregans]
MIVGNDPDAAAGVLVELEDERFAESVLGSETVEGGAVVAEEAVFGGEPEETGVVFDEGEDVEVAEAFVLAVVLEGELLGGDGGGCNGECEQGGCEVREEAPAG